MIFIDSNVPMYLVGVAHPNKDRAVAVLTELVRNGERFITDVEVYQEILHRYTAIQRPDAIDAAFDSLDGIADDVLTFGMADDTLRQSTLGLCGAPLCSGCAARGGDAEGRGEPHIELRRRLRLPPWNRASEVELGVQPGNPTLDGDDLRIENLFGALNYRELVEVNKVPAR